MVQWDGWHLWSAGTQVQSLAQWIKDLALPQLRLGSDPWPGNSICYRVAKKTQKNKRKKKEVGSFAQTVEELSPTPCSRPHTVPRTWHLGAHG